MKKAILYFLIVSFAIIAIPTGAWAKNDYTKKGFALVDKELSRSGYFASLGKPDKKSKVETWGADGLEHQDWLYPKAGVQLNMVKFDRKNNKCKVLLDNQCVFSAEFISTSGFKTSKGIGIGNTKTEVIKPYEKSIDGNDFWDDDTIIAGSIYGGIIFNFKDSKVFNIFIGAAAE